MPSGPSLGNNNASDSYKPLQRPQEMTSAVQPSSRLLKGDPAICPTDQEAVVPAGARFGEGRNSKKMDKQSWDYIIRSGIAGGVAGCAVCEAHRLALNSSYKFEHLC